MKRQRIVTIVAIALFGLSACGGGDNNTPPLTGAIRIGNGWGEAPDYFRQMNLLENEHAGRAL
jgi:hypothetical protein